MIGLFLWKASSQIFQVLMQTPSLYSKEVPQVLVLLPRV